MKYISYLFAFLLSLTPVFSQVTGKFCPPEGKQLLILGQDLGAIGGFDAPNNNGYYENVGIVPGGITTYTSVNSLGGMSSLTNWGSGDICGSCILDNSIYDQSAIAMGLYMAGILSEINTGDYDDNITELANWIKSANRPVYLRIGYEFNGSHNDYDAAQFILAWQHIVDILRMEMVDNCATVWQSDGYGTSTQLLSWYPGDDYVDWLGYSQFDGTGEGMLQIARDKNKPVMICEATPRGEDLDTGDSESIWDNWFAPLFTHISTNSDVIKALAYINVDWDSQSMWTGQGWGDSRVQVSDYIKEQWLIETNQDKWLKSSENLFDMLDFNKDDLPEKVNKPEDVRLLYLKGSLKLINEQNPKSYKLTIYDSTGRQVNSTNKSNTNCWHIPLKQGLYFASVDIGKERLTTRFYVND